MPPLACGGPVLSFSKSSFYFSSIPEFRNIATAEVVHLTNVHKADPKYNVNIFCVGKFVCPPCVFGIEIIKGFGLETNLVFFTVLGPLGGVQLGSFSDRCCCSNRTTG